MKGPMPETRGRARVRRVLPWAAVAAAALVIVLLVSGTAQRRALLVESAQTRAAAEAAAAEIQDARPAAMNDSALLSAATAAAHARHIVCVWLVDRAGTVVYSSGGIAAAGDSVEHMATRETRRILGEVPPGDLGADQRLRLLLASALQAEGEHNDVFRQMVRNLVGQNGELLGLVGVTYEASGALGQPGGAYIALVLLFALAFVTYWLALPAWVYLDARRLGERAVPWTVFVLLSNVAGLIAYLLARPPRS